MRHHLLRLALMRGFRIYDHTEKVGGRRKERTVWDRVCRSPQGALGEESNANASTTATRCFARSATTQIFIGQRPRISYGITSIRFPKTLRCVARFERSSRSPPMQSKLVMAQKRANRTRASWTQSSSMTSSSHPMSVANPCKGWHGRLSRSHFHRLHETRDVGRRADCAADSDRRPDAFVGGLAGLAVSSQTWSCQMRRRSRSRPGW